MKLLMIIPDRLVVGLLAPLAFVSGVLPSHAAQTISPKNRVIQKVNVQLIGFVQGEFTSHGDIDVSKYRRFRVSTKDVLRLMAIANGQDYSSTDLVVTNLNFGNFLVVRGTRVLDDVSNLIAINDVSNGGIRRGKQDTYSSRGNFQRLLIGTFNYQDFAGNNLSLRAFVTETSLTSAVDDKGNQRVSDTVRMKTSGKGRMQGNDAVFTGTITVGGKGNFKHLPPP